jgi:hypothetical protein
MLPFTFLFNFSTVIMGMRSYLAEGSCLFFLLYCDIPNINCDIRDGQSFLIDTMSNMLKSWKLNLGSDKSKRNSHRIDNLCNHYGNYRLLMTSFILTVCMKLPISSSYA